MQYYWVASDENGRVTEGNIEADSPAAVLEWMAAQGLRPISLKAIGVEEKKGWFSKNLRLGGQSITIEDKVFLVKYLALMLRVGTDLFSAIDILIADFDNPAMKALLVEMRGTLGKGQPFYTTFAKYPKHFSPVFVSLVQAGEASGNLDTVFERLSTDLSKQWDLRNRIRGSLVYPIILVTLSLAVLFLMVTFALPRIAEVFTSGDFNPPLFSRVVFSVGLFFRKYLLFILLFFALLGFTFWFFVIRTVRGKRFLTRLVHKVPVVKDVLTKIALQRFASTFASLLRSGMPMVQALETTAEAVGQEELKAALLRIAREGITQGLTVGEAFKREVYFPRSVVNLIAVSEQAGHMAEVLETLANFYESEIDASIKNLVSFLEPVLLLMIGVVVGTIALAIIVPVYQLVTQI